MKRKSKRKLFKNTKMTLKKKLTKKLMKNLKKNLKAMKILTKKMMKTPILKIKMSSPQNPQGKVPFFQTDRQTDISFSDRISQLPISRIKKMLKNADPEWKGGTADAILMLVIAAENFCRNLGEKSFDHVQSSGMY